LYKTYRHDNSPHRCHSVRLIAPGNASAEHFHHKIGFLQSIQINFKNLHS